MNSPTDETEVVRRLFQEHVPEVASGAVEILGIARDAGVRSSVAVISNELGVDTVGACVGNRGDRVKRIVKSLGGEFIDVILWNESAERFIANLLAPLRVVSISFDDASHQARVVVSHDAELPAAGQRALQAQLLLKLTGWDLKLIRQN